MIRLHDAYNNRLSYEILAQSIISLSQVIIKDREQSFVATRIASYNGTFYVKETMYDVVLQMAKHLND